MEGHMSYDDAVITLETALKFGIDPSLEPISALCDELGQPQERYRCIQVAGTNGKTSTARMIAALLHEEGFKVGLYTSPHLVKYPERIEIDGVVVNDELFASGVDAAHRASCELGIESTEFELLTAAALWIFAQTGVDWAVLECGLGGRWDATSVVVPEVAVITGVGLDHTHILGDTLEQIATEKAAIVRAGTKAVFAQDLPAREVFETRARDVGAPFEHVNESQLAACERELSQLPAYQRANFATALTAVTVALGSEPSPQSACDALARLRIPGRFEILRDDPLVIVDAAHNPQSAQALAREIVRRFDVVHVPESLEGVGRRQRLLPLPVLLLGVLADKDARGIVETLCPLFDRVVVTASSSSRAIPAAELAHVVEEFSGRVPVVAPNVPEALDMLSEESFLATGSITVAGEVKAFWC